MYASTLWGWGVGVGGQAPGHLNYQFLLFFFVMILQFLPFFQLLSTFQSFFYFLTAAVIPTLSLLSFYLFFIIVNISSSHFILNTICVMIKISFYFVSLKYFC